MKQPTNEQEALADIELIMNDMARMIKQIKRALTKTQTTNN